MIGPVLPTAIQVIEAQQEPLVLNLIVPGKQGIQGAPAYVHNQAAASTQWTINHNLGYFPSIDLFDSGSQLIEAQVYHQSTNIMIATFSIPISGFARLV